MEDEGHKQQENESYSEVHVPFRVVQKIFRQDGVENCRMNRGQRKTCFKRIWADVSCAARNVTDCADTLLKLCL